MTLDYRDLIHDKERLAEALINEVLAQFNPDSPDVDLLREITPDVATRVARNGIGSGVLADLLAGGDTSVLCQGCDGVCCRECDPIGVTHDDAQRMAKALNTSVKHVIKTYLKPHPESGPAEPYAVQKTKPCLFLGRDGRCTIYQARPGNCRLYPANVAKDGRIWISQTSYCRFLFNAHVMTAMALIMHEVMRRKAPAYAEYLDQLVSAYFPTAEQLEGMSQAERLAAMHAGNQRFEKNHLPLYKS